MATDRTVASCLITGNTRLPLRRTNSKPNVITITSTKIDEATKWRMKYEEAEEKRRKMVGETEKARRSIFDLERRFTNLQFKNEEMETELFEKNESLAKLTTASKSLFKEYDALKNQYELETGAMNRALTDASQWYKENKVLRRRTMMLDTDSVDEGVDACETGSDSDLENLKESVKNMSMEVAHLQAELNSAKLIEFETAENNMQLTQDLEDERKRNERLQQELMELKQSHEQMLRVSNMMKRELEDLKEMMTTQQSCAAILRREADDYKKERNVLAHRSTILMQGLRLDEGLDSLLLMQEIEELKSTLEDERNKHALEIQTFQEKLEEQDHNSHLEILEEQLKLAESELEHALKRAEEAEAAFKKSQEPPAPPPPPPAPPLPPPAPPVVPLRTKKLSRTSPPPSEEESEQTSIDSNKKVAVGGVNDEIINQIKGGMFTLRKPRVENNNKKDRETPKAVSEMLNILGSLKRTAKNRMSIKPAAYGDIQL